MDSFILEAYNVRFAYEQQTGWPVPAVRADPCGNCKRPRSEFPMAFMTEDYCCDNCRKKLGQGLPPLNARF